MIRRVAYSCENAIVDHHTPRRLLQARSDRSERTHLARMGKRFLKWRSLPRMTLVAMRSEPVEDGGGERRLLHALAAAAAGSAASARAPGGGRTATLFHAQMPPCAWQVALSRLDAQSNHSLQPPLLPLPTHLAGARPGGGRPRAGCTSIATTCTPRIQSRRAMLQTPMKGLATRQKCAIRAGRPLLGPVSLRTFAIVTTPLAWPDARCQLWRAESRRALLTKGR